MLTSMALTARQERFVQEYLVDLNSTQAAIRAGYSERSARMHGSRLMTNDVVLVALQAALAKVREERALTVEVDANRVLGEYAQIAFADLRTIFVDTADGGAALKPIKDWPADVCRSMAGIKVKRVLEKRGEDDYIPVEILEFKMNSKNDALRALAEHLGLLKKIHEHSLVGMVNLHLTEEVVAKAEPTVVQGHVASIPPVGTNGHANHQHNGQQNHPDLPDPA